MSNHLDHIYEARKASFEATGQYLPDSEILMGPADPSSTEVGYCSVCNRYNSINTGVCNCANKKLLPLRKFSIQDCSFRHGRIEDSPAFFKPTSTTNNGGDTDYYSIDPSWATAQDIIEARQMNFAQGNIFKAAFTFNAGRHEATTYERELNKIAWFVNRELKRLHSTNPKDSQ